MKTELAVVVMILWQLDLQLPMQSVYITTKVVSSNPMHGVVYSNKSFVMKLVSDLLLFLWFSPGTPASSTNKTDRQDITEILLNTIALTSEKSV